MPPGRKNRRSKEDRMSRIRWFLIASAVLLFSAAHAQQPLTMVLDAPENRADEAQAIVAQLREIGIDASVRIWDSTVLREEMIAGNRTASLTDWGSAYFDAFDLAIPNLRTDDRGNYRSEERRVGHESAGE